MKKQHSLVGHLSVRAKSWALFFIALMHIPLLSYQACSGGFEVKNADLLASSSVAHPSINDPNISPAIQVQPISINVNSGSPAYLSVIAVGANLSYQWFKNNATILGATSATLNFSQVMVVDAGIYIVKIQNSQGQISSVPATLSVSVAPAITQQPLSQTLSQGASVGLSVAATGTDPLTYQWSKNGSVLVGATTATLNLANLTSNDAGNYSVIIKNMVGTATSTSAMITIKPVQVAGTPPMIVTQPQSVTVKVSDSPLLSVTASGTAPLSYQWRLGGVDISGATNASLSVSNIQASQAGSYTVLVFNMAGSMVSQPAILLVEAPPVITQPIVQQQVNKGSTVNLSVVATGSALTYSWQFNETTIVGATTSTLTLPNVQPSQTGSYSVTISNFVGSATSTNTLIVMSPPVITQQPLAQTVSEASDLVLSVTATGLPPLTYEWQYNGTIINFQNFTNSTYSIPSIKASQAGNYSVIIFDAGGGNVQSAVVAISVTPPPMAGALSVSVGNNSACAVTQYQTVKCWGDDTRGELGNGVKTQNYSAVPVNVNVLSGVMSVSIGEEFGCALTNQGTVGCWGQNEISNGVTDVTYGIDYLNPTIISGLTNAVQISSGLLHACALTSLGTVVCWGYNGQFELGNFGVPSSVTPLEVPNLTGVTAIASGFESTCALMSQGTVKCWGENTYGELGNGTTTLSGVPVDVAGLSGVKSISASGTSLHTCAVTNQGTVKCWGENAYGELGNGTTTNSSTPVDVIGITGAVAVGVGAYHTCALTSQGTVKCWGNNDNGQLGNGTKISSTTPVNVVGLTSVRSISAGGMITCIVNVAGAAKCWGQSEGLGNNGNSDSSTPVGVFGFAGNP